MELLEGRTLHHEMKVNPCFPAERVVKIGIQVARSIREAHDLNFVHRDLKPANVFLVEHHDQSDFKNSRLQTHQNFLDDESGFTKPASLWAPLLHVARKISNPWMVARMSFDRCHHVRDALAVTF